MTKKELAKKFNGCTFLKPMWGDWIDPATGKEFLNEENTGMFVLVEKKDGIEAMQFMSEYKEVIKKRFRQLDILILCSPVTRI